MHSCSAVKQSCLCFPVEKWWNSKNQPSPQSSPAQSLVSSHVCSVGRGFQAGGSPVCHMLICGKNLKFLGVPLLSSLVVLFVSLCRQMPREHSVQNTVVFCLAPGYFPALFHKPSPTQQNLHPRHTHRQTRAPAAASALESPVSPLPTRLAETFQCVREEKATAPHPGDAWDRRHCRKSASSFLFILVATYF